MSTTANHGHEYNAAHGATDPHAHVDANTHHHDPHLAHHFDTPEQQFSTGKLGIWLFLATEILMFGGLFCAYAVYRYNHPEVYLWSHHALDAKWGMINTIVLLASSFTMAWGVRAAQLNQRKLLLWMLALTFIGGVGFMCIKAVEYQAKWKYNLFPGEYNSLNADNIKMEGDAASRRAETIGYIESHMGGGHAEETPGADGGHGGEGHNGEGSGTDQSSTHSNTERQPGSGGGSPHVQNNSPNPAATLNPNVAAGANVIQPATSQPVAASTTMMPLGTIAGPDGNRGTPDVALIRPPAFGPSGINMDADQPAGHQWPSYAQMEPTDRAQLNTFFSIYFMMTGLHGIHVVIGMGLMVWLFLRAYRGDFSSRYFTPVDLGGLYWHLVDLIWIFLFPLLYLIH